MMMMSLDGAKVRFYHVTLISNSYTMGCPPVCGDNNNMFGSYASSRPLYSSLHNKLSFLDNVKKRTARALKKQCCESELTSYCNRTM